MTLTEELVSEARPAWGERSEGPHVAEEGGASGPAEAGGLPGEKAPRVESQPILRPLAAAALSASAAGLMVGGIFGSWTARLLGVASALLGIGWTALVLRSKRRALLQMLIAPTAFALGVLSLLFGSDPSKMGGLVADAIEAGRRLRPPVPFDPGWRPIIIVLLTMVGFAAGWVGTAMRRPQIGFALPLPVLILTAISQPKDHEFLAGLLAFIPLLLALAILFGGDLQSMSELTRGFEFKRAVRAVPLVVGSVVLLIVLNNSSFLFPDPAYDPAEKPQKPRAIPLGEVRDRVLFEIDSTITGPWKTGVLDTYDGDSWRLPAFDPDRMIEVGSGRRLAGAPRRGDVAVKFTVRDLGSAATLPGVVGPVSVKTSGPALVYDPVVGVFRVPEGRVPAGLVYTMTLPTYPTAAQLQSARAAGRGLDRALLEIPKPPPAVRKLLDQAPTRAWDRLEFLRTKLNEVVIAVGAGAPDKAVRPATVEELLVGNHEGSPFEIVAAEAMLARWAGVPSRIAYGFDKGQVEDGVTTIRPKNGANWLEVNFEGYGWIPLIGTPPKAKASLDTDPNAKFDETIIPSDDVAVEIYVPIRLEELGQLYEQIRAFLLRLAPYALALAAMYLSLPAVRREWRRRKRRAWAATMGPREQIAVEYAEFRDAATDLNVGNTYDTPLDYLERVVADEDHAELAWLVTRTMFGDMSATADDVDVRAAEELAQSLRRRMLRAQPFQSRVLGALSRASLREPYTLEVPTVRQLRLPRPSLRLPRQALRIKTLVGRK